MHAICRQLVCVFTTSLIWSALLFVLPIFPALTAIYELINFHFDLLLGHNPDDFWSFRLFDQVCWSQAAELRSGPLCCLNWWTRLEQPNLLTDDYQPNWRLEISPTLCEPKFSLGFENGLGAIIVCIVFKLSRQFLAAKKRTSTINYPHEHFKSIRWRTCENRRQMSRSVLVNFSSLSVLIVF